MADARPSTKQGLRSSEVHVEIPYGGPLDLRATVGPLALGRHDPTTRVAADGFVRALRTPEGAATLLVTQVGEGRLEARGFGPGAAWALARAGALAGLEDRPPALTEVPEPLRRFARARSGLRLARTPCVLDLLVPAVLEQLVSGRESVRSFTALVRRFSERAPGPWELWLPLGPEQLLRIPPAAYGALGVGARQAATLRRSGEYAARIEETLALPHAAARERLIAIRGIGPWTAALLALRGLGDPDAVPTGDLHLPSIVAWNLVGEARADDNRMLALLAPFAGQRGRALRWITSAGTAPPRRGPRMPLRETHPAAARWLQHLPSPPDGSAP